MEEPPPSVASGGITRLDPLPGPGSESIFCGLLAGSDSPSCQGERIPRAQLGSMCVYPDPLVTGQFAFV